MTSNQKRMSGLAFLVGVFTGLLLIAAGLGA